MSGPAGADALRLEYRTELDSGDAGGPEVPQGTGRPAHWGEYSFDPLVDGVTRLVCLRDYGGGVVEAGYSSVRSVVTEPQESDESDDAAEVSAEARAKLDAANLDRSVRRSRAQVRRKCLAGELDHLLTLTTRANLEDADEFWRYFKRFVRGVRVHFPEWAYVAVLEYQKRGACHIHLAVHGFQNVRVLRALWLAVIDDGNIDVKGPREFGAAKWKRPKLAAYLGKYIAKNCAGLTGRQRYRVSQNIEIPARTFVWIAEKGRDLVRELFDSLGVSVGFHWKPEGSPHGWACSWS